MEANATNILMLAQARIAQPNQWIQHLSAIRFLGEGDSNANECPSNDPQARCWCMAGAVEWACEALGLVTITPKGFPYPARQVAEGVNPRESAIVTNDCGYLRWIKNGQDLCDRAETALMNAINEAQAETDVATDGQIYELPDFNDNEDVTHKNVMDVFDDAQNHLTTLRAKTAASESAQLPS